MTTPSSAAAYRSEKKMKTNTKILFTIILISTLAVCVGVFWGLSRDEHNTILKSAVPMEVRMPSGKLVSTNEWFTRDPSVDLALLAIKDSTGPYCLIENHNRESKAIVIEDGEEVGLLIESLNSRSNGKKPHILEYTVSPKT